MEHPDLHIQNASRMFGVPEDQVTPHQRSLAKSCTFSQHYGSQDNLKESILRKSILRELNEIVVLYRQPGTMSLYGIPYCMSDGQQPRDLDLAGNRQGWIWLGTPGWLDPSPDLRQAVVQVYLKVQSPLIPMGPGEWSNVSGKVTFI